MSVLQVPGSGDLLEQKPEIEARVREAQAAESGGTRDDLLRDLEPYILRVASKVCKRQISKQDDEFTIALVGLNEAINRYEPGQSSSFLSFAYMVIHRRLIDYYRHEKKHANQVPLVPPNAKENEPHHPEVVSRSFVQYQEEELARARRLEVQHFSQCLERFGIKMSDLVKTSPKHRDTREHLLEIASRIVADKDLLHDFYEQVKPSKELAGRIGLHRRTLQRHRKYLVALTVVLVEDLPLMQEYLGLSSGKKGGVVAVRKGIIMEVGSRDWVVMTSDGEFLHVPKQHHHAQPGDEVIVTDIHMNPVRKWGAIAFAAAALVAGIFLLFPWLFPSDAKAESYVYIDMNPSLELGINGRQEVVMVRPLNQPARQLIQGMDWQRQNIRKFVVSFLERAHDQGYIRDKEGIVLSGVSEKGSAKPLLEQIRQEIRHQPHLATALNVYTLPLPKELRDKAEGTGLSLGKYAVWLLAKREGAPISTNVVANASISQLMDQLKTVEPVLTDPPPEKQWEDWLQEPTPPAQPGDQAPQDSGETDEPPAQSADNPAPAVTEPSPSNGAASDSPQTSDAENPSNSTPDNGQTTAPAGNTEPSPSNQNDTGAADEQGNHNGSSGDGGQDQKNPQAQPTNPPADSANDTGQDEGAHTGQAEGEPSSSVEPQTFPAMCAVAPIPLP